MGKECWFGWGGGAAHINGQARQMLHTHRQEILPDCGTVRIRPAIFCRGARRRLPLAVVKSKVSFAPFPRGGVHDLRMPLVLFQSPSSEVAENGAGARGAASADALQYKAALGHAAASTTIRLEFSSLAKTVVRLID